MEEIFELCDSVTVMKDGQYVGKKAVSDTNEDDLISMMVGRGVSQDHFDTSRKIGEEMLRVDRVGNKHVNNCSLQVHKGEIVGCMGLSAPAEQNYRGPYSAPTRLKRDACMSRASHLKI
jgi:ribose transport system ATP-binding protein